MSIKLLRSVLEYIFMVGTPIVGIVLILHAGQSHNATPPLGKSWQLQVPQSPQSQAAAGNLFQCYGLKLPLKIQLEQSGRFLHTTFGKASATGKIDGNTWQFEFKPKSGACAGKDTRLHGDIQEKSQNWPATLDSKSCTQCAPIPVVILRQKG